MLYQLRISFHSAAEDVLPRFGTPQVASCDFGVLKSEPGCLQEDSSAVGKKDKNTPDMFKLTVSNTGFLTPSLSFY
jgi:hypothetical protein